MKHQSAPVVTAWVLVALTGCATYRPAPIDPLDVLKQLDSIEWSPSLPAQAAPANPLGQPALGPRELASFAVSTNPQLVSIRAVVGVRDALLVEAGLLPDPTLGWDAMDVLASQVFDGTSSSVDAFGGVSLMFPLPRPGERDARVGAAEWQIESARRQLLAAEWAITRNIHVAFEEVKAAEALLAQTQALTEFAASTSAYFERARSAGAATAIQANLALGELQAMNLDALRAAARLTQARQTLNGWLGLPPAAELPLGPAENPSADTALQATPAELTNHAVATRPDLTALLAEYQASEQAVRLAVSEQFPLFSLGTGISLTLPIFSRFSRPKIQTAILNRSKLGAEVTAQVHTIRQEIAAAYAQWQLSEGELALIENELLPNAERNLELTQEAFAAGEITLLETLALQRALVQARTRHTEAKAERSKSAWVLLAASGWLLNPTHKDPQNVEISQ